MVGETASVLITWLVGVAGALTALALPQGEGITVLLEEESIVLTRCSTD